MMGGSGPGTTGGYGPGMMGGYGPGMMGGYGPGMMGGYGPGMMGGYGPGMMGGYGPGMMGGYGPGMMGGYGPGMMGGYGPGMMGGYGPGMMGGYYGPALSADQRKAINAIQDDVRKQHWSMMGAMMDEQAKLRDLYQSGKPDQAAIAEAYKHIGEIQRAMFQSMIEARQKIDAVLSGKQK
ncbi:periplasmic heavy metal sensor [Nitrogeniibacter mangrovi]|uniref:Periplasmic heavy metal sensor n=2 Tax=Nitrogeniibacter mangrovi TaxID=2016596 RepID=A0A6C1BC31_9RHOO|nr:periplasmic heavy metal sensor [Nitrogeniibacter mangrovi]